ncbi:MAG: ATP synthase F0 subunit B [Bacteroidia bacterium]|nr:MAG: ATP synthase F0 subunit B [Bacteroidia bacterium]
MELLMPGLGLIFWMTVSFGFVLLILKKYAWKPILNVLNKREKELAKSFSDAKRIEYEMSQLATIKTTKIAEAEKIHDQIIAKAKEEAESIVAQARERAREEARIIAEKSDELIENYKKAAILELKSQLSTLSMDIAEKIINEEFSDRDRNVRYVNKLLNSVAEN